MNVCFPIYNRKQYVKLDHTLYTVRFDQYSSWGPARVRILQYRQHRIVNAKIMQLAGKFFIFLSIVLFAFHAGPAQAEILDGSGSGTITISPLSISRDNLLVADGCDEAREWYDEGLRLSDDSDREAYYYQQAIDLCPGYVAAHNRLAEVYRKQGKYLLSIDQFEQARIQALASNQFASRSGSRALFLESAISLGEIYRIQGKYERAAQEFSKALQMDPDSLAAQNNLQYVYKRMHRYDNVLSPNNQMLVNALFTRISGLTRPRGTYRFDVQYHTWNQTGTLTDEMFDDERIQLAIPPSERKTEVKEVIASIRYGITNNLTIGLIPKYFSRTLEIKLAAFDTVETPTVKDIGDTELLLKYHVWGERNRHLSIYTLFNLPTGKNIKVLGDEPLTRPGQDMNGDPITEYLEFVRYIPFGSESYDVTPGLAFTLGLDPVILQSNMQYRITDGELIGDEFLLNAAAMYRVNPSVIASLEMNYRWRADVRRKQQVITYALRPDFILRERIPAGALVVDTNYTEFGGHTLFLSPGIQFTVARGVMVEFGMQIPLVRQAQGVTENIVYHLGLSVMTF